MASFPIFAALPKLRRQSTFAVGLSGALSSLGFAAAPTAAENHFLVGYQAYLEKKYDQCAAQLLQCEDLPAALALRAKLYLAACQVPLGYRAVAAKSIDELDQKSLAANDRPIYQSLKQNLKKELDDLSRFYLSLMPYAGSMSYSAGSKVSGQFYGAMASAAYTSWIGRASYESTQIDLKSPLPQYTQSQIHFDIASWFFESLQLRAGMTTISANDSTLDGISVIDGGGTYYLTPGWRAALRLDLSDYPHTRLGNLKATEVTAGMGLRLVNSSDLSLWGDLALQSTAINAPQMKDSLTGFVAKSNYLRNAALVSLVWGSIDLNASFWVGNEAFGVRDEGFVVFNSEEEHVGGLGLGLGYAINPMWSVRCSYAKESYKVTTTTMDATVISASVAVNF